MYVGVCKRHAFWVVVVPKIPRWLVAHPFMSCRYLPTDFPFRPDLGPKYYVAAGDTYASAHLDAAAAVNVLVLGPKQVC